MTRTPFRIRLVFDDESEADYDVIAVQVHIYGDEPLNISTENGLTIYAPKDPPQETAP